MTIDEIFINVLYRSKLLVLKLDTTCLELTNKNLLKVRNVLSQRDYKTLGTSVI